MRLSMAGPVVIPNSLNLENERIILCGQQLKVISVGIAPFAKLHLHGKRLRALAPEMQDAVRASCHACVSLQLTLDHAIQKVKDANEIGFARAIATDENVQFCELQGLVSNGFEISDRQCFESAHGGQYGAKPAR